MGPTEKRREVTVPIFWRRFSAPTVPPVPPPPPPFSPSVRPQPRAAAPLPVPNLPCPSPPSPSQILVPNRRCQHLQYRQPLQCRCPRTPPYIPTPRRPFPRREDAPARRCADSFPTPRHLPPPMRPRRKSLDASKTFFAKIINTEVTSESGFFYGGDDSPEIDDSRTKAAATQLVKHA